MPLSTSTLMWAFIRKYQSLSFFVDNVPGSRARDLFVVEFGASIFVAFTSVPKRRVIPLSARCAFPSANIASVTPRRSSK